MQSATKSVLGIEVSIWPNYFTSDAPKTVNLLTWLTSGKHRARVEQIRTLPGKADRDALKATLPAITVSGLFSQKRTKATLARHSGLIALDFDEKDNRHIQNFTGLRAQLCQIPSVAYCGLSVSGTGFFAIIPIAHPDRHEQQFDALKRIFWQRWRLVADASCRDVSRLRGYSFDADGFFRHNAPPFRLFDEPAPPKPRTFAFTNDADKTRCDILTRLLCSVQAAPDGQRHATLLKVATVVGGYVATGRIDEQTAVHGLETVASEWPNYSKSQKTIRDGIRYGLTKPIYDDRPERSTALPRVAATITPTITTTTPAIIPEIEKKSAVGLSLINEKITEQPPVVAEPKAALKSHLREYACSFHDWQCQDKYFSQMGVQGLKPP